MRRVLIVLPALVLLGVGTTSTPVRADAVTDCAKIQGKAYGVLFQGLFKEAIRACGKGVATAPRPISRRAVGTLTGKFLAGIGKGIDQFGEGVCGIGFTDLGHESVLSSAQDLANQACLVTP
jgi:hypothetical protein